MEQVGDIVVSVTEAAEDFGGTPEDVELDSAFEPEQAPDPRCSSLGSIACATCGGCPLMMMRRSLELSPPEQDELSPIEQLRALKKTPAELTELPAVVESPQPVPVTAPPERLLRQERRIPNDATGDRQEEKRATDDLKSPIAVTQKPTVRELLMDDSVPFVAAPLPTRLEEQASKSVEELVKNNPSPPTPQSVIEPVRPSALPVSERHPEKLPSIDRVWHVYRPQDIPNDIVAPPIVIPQQQPKFWQNIHSTPAAPIAPEIASINSVESPDCITSFEPVDAVDSYQPPTSGANYANNPIDSIAERLGTYDEQVEGNERELVAEIANRDFTEAVIDEMASEVDLAPQVTMTLSEAETIVVDSIPFAPRPTTFTNKKMVGMEQEMLVNPEIFVEPGSIVSRGYSETAEVAVETLLQEESEFGNLGSDCDFEPEPYKFEQVVVAENPETVWTPGIALIVRKSPNVQGSELIDPEPAEPSDNVVDCRDTVSLGRIDPSMVVVGEKAELPNTFTPLFDRNGSPLPAITGDNRTMSVVLAILGLVATRMLWLRSSGLSEPIGSR